MHPPGIVGAVKVYSMGNWEQTNTRRRKPAQIIMSADGN